MTNSLYKYNTKQPLTVVCIGDSTTSQEWCHPNWVDWLNFKFRQSDDYPAGVNRQVINSGYDGQNVRFYMDNFERTIAKFKPDLVIVSLGFNHLEEMEDFGKITEELVEKIKGIDAEVLLWSTYETPNPRHSANLKEAAEIYKAVSEKYKCGYVDMYNEFKKYKLDKLFTFTYPWKNIEWDMKPGDTDFLHCNPIGNQIIAEKILSEAFNTDLSFTKEWESEGGSMGTMIPIDTSKYLL